MNISHFMPHGHCILWNPLLLGTHVLSDFLIFISYFSIPAAIFYYIRKRSIENRVVPILFIAFILSCGVTHIFSIWNWWHTDYWTSGVFKAICAIISSTTAVSLWVLMPKALKLPKPDEFENLEVHAKALEETNREDSSYFASVIHEVRNHLNVINLSSQVLLKRDNNSEDIEVLKSMILRNGQVLNNLINDVLDLSKLKNESISVNYENVSLDSILNELEYEYSERALDRGLQFYIDKKGEVPPNIQTDPMRLLQVLRNLLSNSFKYTSEGIVTLSVEAIKKANSFELNFEISDTGSGIPLEDQATIFERFTRSRLHNKIEGVGIGLSLSKSLAELLGGSLVLKHSDSTGSIFKFSITCLVAEQTKSRSFQKELSAYNWSNRNILIADDAKENRQLFDIALKQTGAKVDFVDNGLDAVESAKNGQYDLILLDIEMPVMDGRLAAQEIKRLKPDSLLIAVTGLSKGRDTDQLMAAGFNNFILKPINLSEFNKVINSHF